MATMESVKVINLWNSEDNHDKLYRLEMLRVGDRCDVFSYYGRRGGHLNLAILCEKAPAWKAEKLFENKIREKARKGYVEITDEVAEVGKSIPHRRS